MNSANLFSFLRSHFLLVFCHYHPTTISNHRTHKDPTQLTNMFDKLRKWADQQLSQRGNSHVETPKNDRTRFCQSIEAQVAANYAAIQSLLVPGGDNGSADTLFPVSLFAALNKYG